MYGTFPSWRDTRDTRQGVKKDSHFLIGFASEFDAICKKKNINLYLATLFLFTKVIVK